MHLLHLLIDIPIVSLKAVRNLLPGRRKWRQNGEKRKEKLRKERETTMHAMDERSKKAKLLTQNKLEEGKNMPPAR